MNEFNSTGYAIIAQPVIAQNLLEQAKSRIAPIMAGQFDTGNRHWGVVNQDKPDQLQRISQIHLCDHAFHNLLTQSNIGPHIAQQIGAQQIRVWGTQLYIKPPNPDGCANVGWHRDSQHILFYRQGVATVWIPLDHYDSHNGPLTYVKGSHLAGRYNMPIGAQQQDLTHEQGRLCDESQAQWHTEAVKVPLGGFSIHHWDLIHGSGINQAKSSRYALSVGIATEKVELVTEHYDHGFHRILHHPHYCPVLFDQ